MDTYPIQSSYRRKTPASILRTARIETMRAGNVEIVVTLPGFPTRATADLSDADNLVLSDEHWIATLYLGQRQLEVMRALVATRDAQQGIENDRRERTTA